MNYKAGDRVRVREDLAAGDHRFSTVGVESEMTEFRGKTVTIDEHLYEDQYLITEDPDGFTWTDSMFSGYAEFTMGDLRSGMVVEISIGDRYLVLKDEDKINFMNANGMTHYGDMCDDHLIYSSDTNFDIVKIFDKVDTFKEVKTTTKLLWERKEPKKMTITEICKELGYDVEIIQECEAENEE